MKLEKSYNKNVKILGLSIIIMCLLQTQIEISCNAQTDDFPSDFVLSLFTDNENYEKGQCIKIFGDITNISDEVNILNEIKITLEQGYWTRYFITNLQNNSYEYFYNISFGDPEGLWNITAEIELQNGDNVNCSKNVNVSLPSNIIRYKVVWFSPSNEAIYYRGSTFDISVFITEDENGASNASTYCIMPTMQKIELSEIKPGYYMESYFIPWDSEIGLWSLSVESIKGTGSSMFAGGSNILIQIQPASLKLDIINNSTDKYVLGEPLQFNVHLSYPDEQNVENATVKLKIANENLTLNNEGNGFYSIDCANIINSAGTQFIEFTASDPFGNSASTTQIIYIVNKEISEFPFYQILGFIFLLIICSLVIIFIKKRFSLVRLNDIENEIKELKRLQNETVTNYYVKGSITRETYDMLQKEYAQRLSELGENPFETVKEQ